MQLTRRDELMLDWLGIVRMADIDGISWALAGLRDGFAERPVTIRRANQWIARITEAGLLDRARPMYRERQIVWPTHKATCKAAPILFRQTMRHELAVSAVSARYLAQGFRWARDTRASAGNAHEADGIATRGVDVEIVEVELTTKRLSRYQGILASHGRRLADGSASRAVYFCTAEVARAVAEQADKFVFRDQRERIVTLPVLDGQGRWVGDRDSIWTAS